MCLKETDVRMRFGIVRMRLDNGSPSDFGLPQTSLLF